MKLLTPTEVAERLGICTGTLRNWRLAGDGPPVIKIGPATYRYSEAALVKYMAAQSSNQPNEVTS
jgi:predicted site-specific integrase-resolvase